VQQIENVIVLILLENWYPKYQK